MQTLPFGELALLEDLITREQLLATLTYQAERREASKPDRKLGTLLVHQGYLTRDDVRSLLRLQRDRGPIEGYVLLERLGSGGMGTVFRAIQKSLEREVALKILARKASKHDRYRARFTQEAKLLAQLKHPNLVRAFEVGESAGHLFFAMEYVRGRTARDLIARYGSIPEPEALDYMEQVAGAIAHYDQQRILHRDIKPENILVTHAGEAKLADLGLSKRLDEDAHITRPGKTLGTPLYISPELARGDETVDIRSDLYSLGATFFHLVCGHPPFESAASADLLIKHVRDPAPDPRLMNPIISEGFATLLTRLLEKRPEKRFASPGALLTAIQRVRRGETPEEPALATKLRERKKEKDKEKDGNLDSSAERAVRARARDGSSAERAAPRGARGTHNRIPTGKTRAASGTFAAVPSTRRAAAPPQTGRTGLVVAFILAASVGAGILAATLNMGNGGGAVGSAGGTTAPAATAAHLDPIAELVQLAKRDPHAALAQAYSFETGHPGEPEQAIARYEALQGVVEKGSPAGAAVDASCGRARRALDYLAAQAFEDLRVEVRELVDVQGKPIEALGKINAFPMRFQTTPAWAQVAELRKEAEAALRR